jgi:hypothetical protein
VTANVLHVGPAALAWTRYAVAAMPPVAAMLALAALLRQVYRLAEHTAPEGVPAEAAAALDGHARLAAERYAIEVAAGEVPSIRRIRREMRVGQPRAQQVRAHLDGLAQHGHRSPSPLPAPRLPAQTQPDLARDARRDP